MAQECVPKIVAESGDEEVLKLFNQEYWNIDSLNVSGVEFGVLVSGDKGILHLLAAQRTILRPGWTRSERCKPQRIKSIKCEHEIQSEADDGIQKDKEGRNVGGRQFGLPSILQPSAELRFAQVHGL